MASPNRKTTADVPYKVVSLKSWDEYLSIISDSPYQHWAFPGKRKATHFLENVPDRTDDFEWLALMQDHGAPTRLLDFSWSPYVAAFFALHNATSDGVIWACNPVEIRKKKKVHLKNPDSFRKKFLIGSRSFVWIGE